MNPYKQNKLKQEKIGTFIDYIPKNIWAFMRLFDPHTNKDKKFALDGNFKSIRCKIVDLYFTDKLIGNKIHFGYEPILEVQRKNRYPVRFHAGFISVEKIRLDV